MQRRAACCVEALVVLALSGDSAGPADPAGQAHRTASKQALWFRCPYTPPSSKVTICGTAPLASGRGLRTSVSQAAAAQTQPGRRTPPQLLHRQAHAADIERCAPQLVACDLMRQPTMSIWRAPITAGVPRRGRLHASLSARPIWQPEPWPTVSIWRALTSAARMRSTSGSSHSVVWPSWMLAWSTTVMWSAATCRRQQAHASRGSSCGHDRPPACHAVRLSGPVPAGQRP